MLIQIAIIVLGLFLVYRGLASRRSHSIRAWKKLGLVLFALIMIFSVLNPDALTALAKIAGIGRGADLVLYVMAGTFIFYVLTQYMNGQATRDVIYRLARQQALMDAHNRYRFDAKD